MYAKQTQRKNFLTQTCQNVSNQTSSLHKSNILTILRVPFLNFSFISNIDLVCFLPNGNISKMFCQ